MYQKIFAGCGVKFPKTLFRSINCVFLDENYSMIRDVEKHINQIQEDVIVKPTVETGSGQGIRKYTYDGKNLVKDKKVPFNMSEIVDYYAGNFIIQSVVNQNEELARFHPYSLNTVRAFSYRSVKTNLVHVPTVVLRMGINRSYLDTVSTGGIACRIMPSGLLINYAFDLYGNSYEYHPTTHERFEGSLVPAFDKVISLIKELANCIPHQRVAGWDFGIDAEFNPVLIEVNVSTGSWLMQIISGKPLFGDFSAEVKEYIDSIV
jgi:hypothetical protein